MKILNPLSVLRKEVEGGKKNTPDLVPLLLHLHALCLQELVSLKHRHHDQSGLVT